MTRFPLIGFTWDSVWKQGAVDWALHCARVAAHCPRRPLVRIVFDPGMKAKDYRDRLKLITPYADILGCPVDSTAFKAYPTRQQYRDRFDEYLGELADLVWGWEVGNEPNGEWCLKDESPMRAGVTIALLIEEAMTVCKGHQAKTWLTPYLNPGTAPDPAFDVWNWLNRNPLPQPDFVGFSRYDCDNGGPLSPQTWQESFNRLGDRFPDSHLTLSECGDDHLRGDALAAYIKLLAGTMKAIQHPRFVGFGGWWYARQQFDPPVLNRAFTAYRDGFFA